MNGRMARMDMGLFTAILLMLGFGIVLVYSSSFAVAENRFGGADFFLARHALRALLAIVALMVFVNIDYHVWGKLSNLFYLISVILLIAVLLLPESYAVNGAKRWIGFGALKFQVSDLARMALILVLARSCEKAGNEIKQIKIFINLLIKIGIICGLVVLEPSFSASLIIAVIGFSMLFMAGSRLLHFFALVLSTVPLMAIIALSAHYRIMRLIGFFHMSGKKDGLNYQVYQSLVGFGNGGLFGVGIGKGEQKFFYLPEPHTDFAISILGEEIGFVGLMIVFGIFIFIIYRGMKAALNAPDRMGQLLAFAFTFEFTVMALFHCLVGTGLVPTTGVALPFLSYGGMSLVFMMISMGIVLNISSQASPIQISAKSFRGERLVEA
jgi:cell division protein FtsW